MISVLSQEIGGDGVQENERVENAGGDCSKYGKPIVLWLDN